MTMTRDEMLTAIRYASPFVGGDDYAAAADEWLAAGFSPAAAEEWWDAGCFCATAAADLRDAGLSPADIAVKVDGESIGYRVSGGSLSVAGARRLALIHGGRFRWDAPAEYDLSGYSVFDFFAEDGTYLGEDQHGVGVVLDAD